MPLDSNIRTLGPGEKISEDGFYAIPIEIHHAQPCIGPSVTSGVLRKMEMHSPAKVWATHQLNPDRYESEETDALRLGRAMASLVEGGAEALHQHFQILPEDKPNRPTKQQVKAYQEGRGTEAGIRSIEFWAKVEADPRDILSKEEWEKLVMMGAALARDPACSAALGGHPEITMAFEDPETGIWCLSRPDQVSFGGMLSDYKKVNCQGRPFDHRACDVKITAMGYDMQMGFAAEAFERLTGEWPGDVGLVFQEDQPPYSTILRGIEEEDLHIAMFRNRDALRRFANCLEKNHWPGPGEDVGAYQRPEWQRQQIIDRMSAEGVYL